MIEGFTQWLSQTDITQNAVELFAAIVLALAARWVASDYSKRIQASRFGAMYDAILAGAASVYQSTYKGMKERAKDGVLSRDDIDRLSTEAYREAVNAAQAETVKQALRDVSEAEWTRLLQKAVGQLKAEGGATSK